MSHSKQEKRKWSDSDDEALLGQVHSRRALLKSGQDVWGEIAEAFPGRTSKQCRERYQHHLQPDVNKSPWGCREESFLFHMQSTIGNCWTDIARALPGRSDCACKNRYYSALRRVERALRGVSHLGGGGGAAMAATLMTALSRASMAPADFERVQKLLKRMGGRAPSGADIAYLESLRAAFHSSPRAGAAPVASSSDRDESMGEGGPLSGSNPLSASGGAGGMGIASSSGGGPSAAGARMLMVAGGSGSHGSGDRSHGPGSGVDGASGGSNGPRSSRSASGASGSGGSSYLGSPEEDAPPMGPNGKKLQFEDVLLARVVEGLSPQAILGAIAAGSCFPRGGRVAAADGSIDMEALLGTPTCSASQLPVIAEGVLSMDARDGGAAGSGGDGGAAAPAGGRGIRGAAVAQRRKSGGAGGAASASPRHAAASASASTSDDDSGAPPDQHPALAPGLLPVRRSARPNAGGARRYVFEGYEEGGGEGQHPPPGAPPGPWEENGQGDSEMLLEGGLAAGDRGAGPRGRNRADAWPAHGSEPRSRRVGGGSGSPAGGGRGQRRSSGAAGRPRPSRGGAGPSTASGSGGGGSEGGAASQQEQLLLQLGGPSLLSLLPGCPTGSSPPSSGQIASIIEAFSVNGRGGPGGKGEAQDHPGSGGGLHSLQLPPGSAPLRPHSLSSEAYAGMALEGAPGAAVLGGLAVSAAAASAVQPTSVYSPGATAAAVALLGKRSRITHGGASEHGVGEEAPSAAPARSRSGTPTAAGAGVGRRGGGIAAAAAAPAFTFRGALGGLSSRASSVSTTASAISVAAGGAPAYSPGSGASGAAGGRQGGSGSAYATNRNSPVAGAGSSGAGRSGSFSGAYARFGSHGYGFAAVLPDSEGDPEDGAEAGAHPQFPALPAPGVVPGHLGTATEAGMALHQFQQRQYQKGAGGPLGPYAVAPHLQAQSPLSSGQAGPLPTGPGLSAYPAGPVSLQSVFGPAVAVPPYGHMPQMPPARASGPPFLQQGPAPGGTLSLGPVGPVPSYDPRPPQQQQAAPQLYHPHHFALPPQQQQQHYQVPLVIGSLALAPLAQLPGPPHAPGADGSDFPVMKQKQPQADDGRVAAAVAKVASYFDGASMGLLDHPAAASSPNGNSPPASSGRTRADDATTATLASGSSTRGPSPTSDGMSPAYRGASGAAGSAHAYLLPRAPQPPAGPGLTPRLETSPPRGIYPYAPALPGGVPVIGVSGGMRAVSSYDALTPMPLSSCPAEGPQAGCGSDFRYRQALQTDLGLLQLGGPLGGPGAPFALPTLDSMGSPMHHYSLYGAAGAGPGSLSSCGGAGSASARDYGAGVGFGGQAEAQRPGTAGGAAQMPAQQPTGDAVAACSTASASGALSQVFCGLKMASASGTGTPLVSPAVCSSNGPRDAASVVAAAVKILHREGGYGADNNESGARPQ